MILCCGEALIDMLPDFSKAGNRCFVPKVGGSVFNTAIALGRLSANVYLFAGISQDLFGKMLEKELVHSKVGTQYLVHFDNPSSLAFVDLFNQQAEYTFYTNDAADTMLRLSDFRVNYLKSKTMFFGGISLCKDPTASTMLKLMLKSSISNVIMIDPNIRIAFISDEVSYRKRLTKMLSTSDIIKMSDADLEWLVPDKSRTHLKIEKLFGKLKKLIIITKGEKGSYAFFGSKKIAEVVSIPVKVVDTIGAGDTFNAGLIYSLQQQRALTKQFCRKPNSSIIQEALKYANRLSSFTVSKVGANPPWLNELK